MKKIILFLLVAASFTACFKDDDNGGTAPPETGFYISFDYIPTYNKTLDFYITSSDLWVDWGDGSTTSRYNDGRIYHSYNDQGYKYKVWIDSYNVKSITLNADYNIGGVETQGKRIENLKINNCPALDSLILRNVSELYSFTSDKCPALKNLTITGNNDLGMLTLTASSELETLNCDNNALGTLTIYRNTKLKEVTCSNNHLNTISISNLYLLEKFECKNNELIFIDIENNPSIQTVEADDNRISNFTLRDNWKLSYISLKNNSMSAYTLNALFGKLPENTGGVIYVKGNPGVREDEYDESIATNRGWSVVH